MEDCHVNGLNESHTSGHLHHCGPSSHSDPGFGHVTYFGQLNLRKCDKNRGLINTCPYSVFPPTPVEGLDVGIRPSRTTQVRLSCWMTELFNLT